MRFHIRLGFILACITGLLAAAAQADASSYQVVHSFKAGIHGSNPAAGLIQRGVPPGRLYGTTIYGGTAGCGTVFEVKPDSSGGAESVKYAFQCINDGAYLDSSLIFVDGTFYGTTPEGGVGTCTPCWGTLFSLVSKTDKETVLHTFNAGADGAGPQGGLIDVGGVLYGTTPTGGAGRCGCGTVFSFTLSTGTEAVVYTFQGGVDAARPDGGLIDVGGVLYGTTPYGGTGRCGLPGGCGTVFSLNPATGAETVVYSFQNHADGGGPDGALLNVGGKLYGSAGSGGTYGAGVVFVIDPATGQERVLHSFGGPGDGSFPNGGLTAIGDTLYGTTAGGSNAGTVFAVERVTGAETVLHVFQGLAAGDGSYPRAGMIDVGGTLYGTTFTGGTNACVGESGCGTVFAYTP